MPRLVVNVPYEILEKIMKDYPNLPPEEAIKQYLIDTVSKGVKVEHGKGLEAYSVREGVAEVKCVTPEELARFRRSVEDLLNPATGKLDGIRNQLATVIEVLEGIVERIKDMDSKVSKLMSSQQPQPEIQPPQVKPVARAREAAQPRRRRTSAIEILRDQKVMYEADIASKIKNRDAFFERLKRDGAVVLELSDQRVAVDPDYWREFTEKLRELRTNSEPEIEKVLGRQGLQLLKALMRSTMAYYDAVNKKWELIT